VLGGSAVFEAANALLAKIRAAAAARLGCAAEQVELSDGCVHASDGRSLAFDEFAADGLRVTTAFGNDNRLTYTYGSAAAHVAVDPGTGDVELLDCLVVEDVGRIVNPLTLHGQAIGGWSRGWVAPFSSTSSMTQTSSCWPATSPTTDPDGDRLSQDPGDCAREPPVTEQPARRQGRREGAIIPIGGLMANAVTSFGAMPNQLPLSPARVWHMSSAKTNARNRGTPLRPRRPVRATGREKRGDDQIHRARVLEVRIHSPPADSPSLSGFRLRFRKSPGFQPVWGRARAAGSPETRKVPQHRAGNGSVSVGRYSSTAVSSMGSRRWGHRRQARLGRSGSCNIDKIKLRAEIGSRKTEDVPLLLLSQRQSRVFRQLVWVRAGAWRSSRMGCVMSGAKIAEADQPREIGWADAFLLGE
jgi:hypothetical protein